MTEKSPHEIIAELKRLPRKQVKQIFQSLPVPTLEEFCGEYKGVLLQQGTRFGNAVTRFFVNKDGVWLGKAFRKVSETECCGYNIFQTRAGIQRSLRMSLWLRDIHGEGQHRLMIEYQGKNEGFVGGIYDDMRRLAPGVFLGVGTVPFGGRLLPKVDFHVMFALYGPVAEFQDEAAEKDVFQKDERYTGMAA